MALIEFDKVSFVQPSTGALALADVDLSISKGETVAIVGENGAGKSTLVRHIDGLLKPTRGTVRVDGVDTRSTTTASLSRRVGVAFQNPDHQLFSENVESEVAFALRNFGFGEDAIKERVDSALASFGLEPYRKTSPLVLSGGEKKRLTLACILAWDPDVLVLDEPTVGQDALQKEKLAQTMAMFRSSGRTVILVSHDVEFLWPIQPRLVVMSGGRVAADGRMAEVMADRDALEKARVTQPQLLRLWQDLSQRPAEPFPDVEAARDWVDRGLGGDGGGDDGGRAPR